MYDANGSVVGMKYNGAQYWYQKNMQGDVVRILNSYGRVVAIYTYDAWGKILQITDGSGNDVSGNPDHIANINPFRYRGYYYDVETGWYYLNSRYYDPTVGRFLSPDTILGANGGLQGYNLFAYCNNNPVMFADATGYALHRANTAYAILETDGRAYIGVCMNSVTISKAIEETLKSFEEEQPKRSRYQNSDGSYSLYDNKRFDPDKTFREQIAAFDASPPNWNLKDRNVGLGSLEADLYSGGWEWEHADLSLFDFGHAELGAEFNSNQVKIGAMVSAWSPSASITFFGVTIGISFEVGSIGANFDASSNGFNLNGAAGFGLGISVSWD
mgnify:FL=1